MIWSVASVGLLWTHIDTYNYIHVASDQFVFLLYTVYFCVSEKDHAYKHPVSQKACTWMRFPLGEDDEFASLFESLFQVLQAWLDAEKMISTQASKRIGVFGSSFRGEGNEFKKASCWWNGWVLGQKFEHKKLPIGSTSKSIKSPISLRQVIKNTKHGLLIRRRHVPCLHSKNGKNIRTAWGVMKKHFLGWEPKENPKYITGYQ